MTWRGADEEVPGTLSTPGGRPVSQSMIVAIDPSPPSSSSSLIARNTCGRERAGGRWLRRR